MYSFWEKDHWFRYVDVAIVGGGLLGMWTALELKKRQPALDVLVVEKSCRTQGASSRNAGFACFGSPGELLHDARTMGVEQMLSVVEMRLQGIEKIRKTFKASSIDYEPCGGYECFTSNYEVVREALPELNAWLKPVVRNAETFKVSTNALEGFGLHFNGMVSTSMESAIHSGKLTEELYLLAHSLGVRFLYGIPVTHWESGHPAILHLGSAELKAGKIIFCTNAWLSHFFPELHIKPARGQILLTKVLSVLPLRGTFHFDDGFYYWRHLNGRILLGGARNSDFEGEETHELNISDHIQNMLEAFLKQHFPGYAAELSAADAIAQRWSGLMAMTADKRPLIKETASNILAACCCNGMGVALSPVFGEKIADRVLTTG